MSQLTQQIEDELAREAGVYAAVEERDGSIVISGIIETEEQRQAALDIVKALTHDTPVVDDLEVESVLPEDLELEGIELSEADSGVAGATPGSFDNEALEPGNFTDQRLLNDPYGAAGPGGTTSDEDISEGEEVYVPPIDPVMDGDRVIGGFAFSSLDSVEPALSSDGRPGDEAIASAVRRELREDAATNGLRIHVHVEQGVVRLRGTVQDVLDAENAEEVASRVTGVIEVLEELEVESGAF